MELIPSNSNPIPSNPLTRIWQRFAKKTETEIAIKSAVVAALSLFVGVSVSRLMGRPDKFISGAWCVMTSIVVLQASIGGTYKAAWKRFLGVLIGSFMGGIFTITFGTNPLSLGISIGLTVMTCCSIHLKESYRIACLSVAIVMVLWGLNPTLSPWQFSLYRLVDSTIGILIAVIIAHLLWPTEATKKMRLSIAQTLALLSKLYRLTTEKNPSTQEKNLEIQKLALKIDKHLKQISNFLEESRLERLTRTTKLEHWSLIFRSLQQIFDKLLNLRDVYKKNLENLLDDDLSYHLASYLNSTDLALQELSQMFQERILLEPHQDLEQIIDQMSKDLDRFRDTRATRQFNLPDVEGYFVYFFDLKSIGESLLQLEKTTRQLF